ncbi:MAG: hypothetical protein WDA20_10535 [Desulfuromonadales bacterium]
MGRKSKPIVLSVLALALCGLPAKTPGAGMAVVDASTFGQPRLGSIHTEMSPRQGFKALFANDQVAGLDTFVIYLLQNDTLMQTKFLFPQKHVKTDLFLEDFTRVEETLREKYGPPAEAGEFWRTGAHDKTAGLGRMVAIGELTLRSAWETEDLVIVHTLAGESLDIDHEVNYISKSITQGAAEVMQSIRPLQFF